MAPKLLEIDPDNLRTKFLA